MGNCPVHPALAKLSRDHLDAMRPRRLRSFLQFAEDEVVLARGPRDGWHFDADYVPWTAIVLREFDNPWWWWRLGMGSVQAGKTLIFFVIPALYHLFEIGESVILAAPSMDLVMARYEIDILPVIQRTRYRELLPTSGSGSRGGRAESVRFRNGARLIFMSGGGKDVKRSSHTARVVLLTESDKMDAAGETSRETAPPFQLLARSTAYGERALFYGECTVSIEAGFIYQQASVGGSGSRIYLRCPACRKHVYPDRDHFVGWREATSELEAGALARYACNSCGALWDEAARQKALRNPLLLHRGQEISPKGKAVGDLPQTHRLGVEWTWLASPMTTMAIIGMMEWNAVRAVTDDLDKDLTQFRWTMPWKEDMQVRELSTRFLAQHTGEFHFDPLRDLDPELPHAALPEGPEFWTCSIDVQLKRLYLMIDGWDFDLTRWSTHWRVLDILEEEARYDPTEDELRAALDKAWALSFERYNCESLWIDAGFRAGNLPEHVILKWCHEHDFCNPLVGRSATEYAKMTGKSQPLPDDVPAGTIQLRLQADGNGLWFFEVDRLKDDLYGRLFRAEGSPGYHWFAREAANEKRSDRSHGRLNPGWIFNHFMKVKREISRDNRGREIRIWRERGAHDMVDVAAYGLAGAIVTRAYLLEENATDQEAKPDAAGSLSIRTSY